MARRRCVYWLVGACVVALAGFLFLAGTVRAEEETPLVEEGAEDAGSTAPTRTPFLPYAADPGALTYESLYEGPIPDLAIDPEASVDEATYRIVANETRASVDDVETWAQADNGYEVHQQWAAYSQLRQQQIEVERAEREAGLGGIGDLGVE